MCYNFMIPGVRKIKKEEEQSTLLSKKTLCVPASTGMLLIPQRLPQNLRAARAWQHLICKSTDGRTEKQDACVVKFS